MTIEIGLLAFPGVQQLDLTGPYEVFASLPEVSVHIVAESLAPIQSATGLILIPTMRRDACPALDVICIPGGVGVNALMQDEGTLAFVRAHAASARFVTSVCTGALVLAAAGLLEGRRATTHWASLDLLAAFGAIPVAERVVRDGRFVTGGGVTAGIDFALTLAAELLGRPAAEAAQLALEYAPAPPFASGTPDGAAPAVLAAARSRLAASRATRESIVMELTGSSLPRADWSSATKV